MKKIFGYYAITNLVSPVETYHCHLAGEVLHSICLDMLFSYLCLLYLMLSLLFLVLMFLLLGLMSDFPQPPLLPPTWPMLDYYQKDRH